MREKRTIQASLFDVFSKHELGRELKAISAWLDGNREMLEWVGADLVRRNLQPTGRKGLSVETVLRCALLKQHRQLSYEELAFYLSDSFSFRAFARLPVHWTPKKSVLQRTIAAIRAETWEAINHCLMGAAKSAKVENGKMMRLDSTVTEAPIHAPADSLLLGDGMRVMVRLLRRADALAPGLIWRDHSRRAKRRCQEIAFGRGADKRKKPYRDLIKITRATLDSLRAAACRLGPGLGTGVEAELWQAETRHYAALIESIIAQAERRVLSGEQVAAGDKLVSLFEPHADIIVKGRRDVQYGHKLNLSTGKSGMILDLVIEAGNPADAERFKPMLDRHITLYGRPPRQTAVDGGYASSDNLAYAKAKGVEDAAFHKKRGLNIEDMVRSRWVYRKLRNFRAGVEANISCLKRAYGLARCTWKGLDHFKAYVWSSVLAYNLALFARLKPT
mgnify:CR=1 FL=1|jgi:IS5 family transposase|tara:strand:+ start:192 stop:1532 length:1341 start_codon:yes stop_codon:yes gene_type:complete